MPWGMGVGIPRTPIKLWKYCGSKTKIYFTCNFASISPELLAIFSLGPCTNHEDRILGNFDPLPLCRHSYLIAVTKCCGHFSNPPPPHLYTWFVHAPSTAKILQKKYKKLHFVTKISQYLRPK